MPFRNAAFFGRVPLPPRPEYAPIRVYTCPELGKPVTVYPTAFASQGLAFQRACDDDNMEAEEA